MDLTNEFLNHALAAMNSDLSDEDKEKYRSIFVQIFKEGKIPSQVLGFNKEMVEQLYSYGHRLYNLGSYQKALHVFTGIGMLDPNDSRFSLAAGACHHRLKQWEEAVNDYYRCSQQDVDNPMPHYFMYDCFIQAEMWGDAAFCLEEVIKRCGDLKIYDELKTRCQLLLQPLHTKIEEIKANIEKEEKLA